MVLISGHHIGSARRAGFHHLAFAYRRMGWRVTFITVGMSLFSLLRPDHRRDSFQLRDRNRSVAVEPRLVSYVWFTAWHPSDTRSRVGNRLTLPAFRRFAGMPFEDLPDLTEGASTVVVESGYGLFLVPRLRQLLPTARLVYRQSDDLGALLAHPVLHEAERSALPLFDLISVPDEDRARRFPRDDRVRVQAHGVDTALLTERSPSPYDSNTFAVNAVFVGVSGLDYRAVAAAAEGLPDWGFHLVGPWSAHQLPANVVAHGELAFIRTAPLIVHADVGLHTLALSEPASYRMTNKVLQYTFCRLPIVAEEEAAPRLPHVFTYARSRPHTIVDACRSAHAFPPDCVPSDAVHSWETLGQALTTEEPVIALPAPPTSQHQPLPRGARGIAGG